MPTETTRRASPASWDFDVAVIGGGPGGSSAATTLARHGRRVLVLERERFPRFHIGESQLPWTNEVLRTLGVYETVAGAGFVEKWGASFWAPDGSVEQYADFSVAAATPTPRAYQVPRAQFDDLLLSHAERSGADVRQEHRALDAAVEPGGVHLRYAGPDGVEATVWVGAVVDASGRSGFLARSRGRHVVDPLLRNIAVHAQYENVPRASGRRAGDIRMLIRPDLGWLWLIPLSETMTSVGAVIPQAVHRTESRGTPEACLDHYLSNTPGADALMKDAQRVSPARFDADYSYLGSRLAGDRWVAVGDAAAFLDPIFSTGVLLAMQGGVDAAEVIHRGLADGDLSAPRFAKYERLVQQRYHHFRRFAVGFYTPAFRDLWFRRSNRLGVYEAVLSVLAGNWRPSPLLRLRIGLFFTLVKLQRLVPLAPRMPWDPPAR